MKKITLFLITIIGLIGLSSCEHDDDVVFTAAPETEGIAFQNSPQANYILTTAAADNVGERFVWNELTFDAETNVNYDLLGSATEDFSNYSLIGSQLSVTNASVSIGEMMDLAEEAGLDNDPTSEAPNTGTIYFKVIGYPGTNPESNLAVTSSIMALTVTLPEETLEMPPKDLYLVGDATPTGWDNTATSNNYALYRDPDNQNVFYYTGKLNAGNVKIIENRGAWAPQYGGENGTLIYRPTEDVTDPPSIPVATAGYYTFTVDIDAMTYTLESYDASGAATYSTIGYIGTATPGGWDSDTDLTQSSFDPHIWYALDAQLTEGEFKFRAGNDWTDNWGVASEALSGKAAYGSSDNMTVVEGTYEIWFNDLTGRYILIPAAE